MRGYVRYHNVSPFAPGHAGEGRLDEAMRDFYRLDSRRRRVLVLGSTRARAATGIGWADELPNLADFDVVILCLPSLDRATLVKLSRTEKDRLTRMRGQLFDVLLSGGEVYCILSPFIAFGSYLYFPDGSVEPEWSNLKWSPIGFSLTEIKGETLRIEADVKFDEYLRQVAGWEGYINPTASLGYIEERLQREGKLSADEEVFWQSFPLAMNRYGKPLAASLCFGVRQRESEHVEPKIRLVSDYLHLLPPPTKVSLEQGLDLLVEEAKGLPARSLAPPWSQRYHVPGEERLEQKMNESLRRIKAAEREHKRQFQNYRDLKRCTALLYEHGDNLRHLAADILRRLEFSVAPYPPAPDLLVVATRLGKVLLDAAGRSGPAQPGDLHLLSRHALYAQEEDGRIWKGVLVFNHYRLEDPATSRPAAFSAEIAARAREYRFGLASAEGLYAAFCAIRQGSMLKEELEEKLARTVGILDLPGADPQVPASDAHGEPATNDSGPEE